MTPIQLLLISLGIYLLGAVVTFFMGRARRLSGYVTLFFVLLAAIGIYNVVVHVFIYGPVESEGSLFTVPGIGAELLIRVDQLSALFMAIVALITVLVVIYAIPFMQMPYYEGLSMMGFYPVLQVFFMAVMAVIVMADWFFFIIFWEFMTLTSYGLVVFDRKRPERLRAGFKYFLITHIATGLMFLGVIILYTFGRSFRFDVIAETLDALRLTNPGVIHFALTCFFIAFATKAGILPFGDWLPDAYPAAPTPATSAFAGSMTNLGVYGLLRIFVDLLPISTFSKVWGLVLAVFGTLSIFVGTMTALRQEDTKRLVAFNVIGQMGYIFLGIGTGLYFLKEMPALGIIAISAGIFHLINGVWYKSCLFLNAGSIFYRAGTRDLNGVGGLSKVIPLTALTAVIASLSISGVPPFNGFSSKWIIFQSTIRGGMDSPLFIAMAIVAIFISAVTLAALMKFFGSAFFGKFHASHLKPLRNEVPVGMGFSQIILAFLCVLFGIVPLLPIRFIHIAVSNLFPSGLTSAGPVPPLNQLFGGFVGSMDINFGEGVIAGWHPVLLSVIGLGLILISYGIFRIGGAPVRGDKTWYCGEEHTDLEVHYKARGLYLSFKEFFRIRIGKYQREGVYPTISYPKIQLREENWLRRLVDVDRWFFYPITRLFMKIIDKFANVHVGVPHVYLLWAVIGVLAAVVIIFSLA